MPFIDTAELAGVLGEAHATVHHTLTDLLADGIAMRVSYGTAQLPSSQRYYLTANGIRRGCRVSSDLRLPRTSCAPIMCQRSGSTLLIRRMDAVADIYRLVASQEGAFPEHKALIRNFVEGIEVIGDERRR